MTPTPLPETGPLCTDQIDNDLDGATDCADPGCALVRACAAPTPVLSPIFILLTIATLTLVGLLSLYRKAAG